MDMPKCKNKSCPKSDTHLLKESPTEWVFGCYTCTGIEVRTKPAGWKAGQQNGDYHKYGRPEYARNKAFFFQGRRHTG